MANLPYDFEAESPAITDTQSWQVIKTGSKFMNLSAPTMMVFVISLVIAVLGALAGFGILSIIPIPAVSLLAIGYIVLAAGCLLKGM